MSSLRRSLVATSACLLFAWGGDGRGAGPARDTVLGASPDEARPALAASGLARIDEAWQAYLDSDRLAGAVLLVQRDGVPVYARAWGHRDREAGDPMREDTIFRIASQTKALVSVGVMMLAEEGRLRLDDPLGRYLPAWAETTVAVAAPDGGYTTVPAKRPITVHDLLTHTAGISYAREAVVPGNLAWREAGIVGWYLAGRDEPMSRVVDRMAALPMMAQPGEDYLYGYSTDILGVLIEQVSGQSLETFLSERLLQPLGMVDTHFFLPREKAPRLAVVYSAVEDGIERAPEAPAQGDAMASQGHYVDGPRIAQSGGAGLLSTVRDYSRFLEMLRRGGELDGRRYLSAVSVAEMTRNQIGTLPFRAGAWHGLGFEVIEDPQRHAKRGSAGSYGWGGAYHSTYWVDPAQGLTVVYLTQLIPNGGLDDHTRLRELLYQALD